MAATALADMEDTRVYKSVKDHEGRYSWWFADRPIPKGWEYAGCTGTKKEVLDFGAKTWTDMTPLSVRIANEERAAVLTAEKSVMEATLGVEWYRNLCMGEFEVKDIHEKAKEMSMSYKEFKQRFNIITYDDSDSEEGS